jgi:N-methylhydantoinase A
MPADPVAMRTPRLRIGIDTGGTFTDVVAFDEVTGALTVTKTPSTPADPAQGFMTGLAKMLGLLGSDPAEIVSISHGTTIATNQLLAGDVGELGFVTTEGYEFMLEIARQSVPDGYGNSYFWVKPDRIVPPDFVKTVGGRLDHTGMVLRPFDSEQATAVARWFRDRGIGTLGVCFLHSYANPEHEERMARVLAREHPDAVVSLSSQVLPEYREYERSMTTLIDAAVKPRVAQYLSAISERLAGLRAGAVPLHVMTSNGGVATAAEVIGRPIATVLSGPAAGAVGAAMIAQNAGITSVLTCDGGGTSTDVAVVVGGEPALTTEGSVGAYPSRSGRGRRALIRDRCATPRAAATSLSPTRTLCSAGSRRICLAARSPWTLTPRDPAWPTSRRSSACRTRSARPGSWKSQPGTRPTRCARSLSSAASTCATSPWSRSADPGRC